MENREKGPEGFKESLKNTIRIQDVVDRIDSGDDMQMMSPLLEAMTIISAAKTMKPGISYLFLSQCFLNYGIDSEKNEAGFVGPNVNCLVDKITEGLLSPAIFSPKPEIAQAMLLKKMVKMLVILSICAGKLLAIKMEGSPREVEVAKVYVNLVLKLSSSSKIVENTLREFTSVLGGSEKTTGNITEILTLIFFILVGYVAMRKKGNFQAIIELLSKEFVHSLEKIDGLIENVQNENWSAIQASVTQAKISLDKGSFEDFDSSIKLALEAINIKKSDLDKDIIEIEEMTLRIYNILSFGLKDFAKNPTEMSVVV